MGKGSKGSSSSKAKAKPVVVPKKLIADYANLPTVGEIAPFMGNNQQLLAEQLSKGFGGGEQSYNDRMDSVYNPMKQIGLLENLTETKANLKKDYNLKSGSTGLLSLDKVLGITGKKVNG